MINQESKRGQKTPEGDEGFTIVELMIAISIFAVLLLLCTVGIIRISQSYFRGITQANTQQTARGVMEDITQNIQFGGQSGITRDADGGDIRAVCIGQQRYTYGLNYQQKSTGADITKRQLRHGIWRDVIANPGTCSEVNLTQNDPNSGVPSQFQGKDGRDLLGENMRIMSLDVVQSPTEAELFSVRIVLMYGDSDLIAFQSDNPTANPAEWSTVSCKESRGLIGAAFCARAELSTTVGKRLR